MSDKEETRTEQFGGIDIQEESNIPTPASFSKMIESRAAESGESVIDIIIEYCEETGLDPDTITKLVNSSLRDKMAYEARYRNMFKEKDETAELPI